VKERLDATERELKSQHDALATKADVAKVAYDRAAKEYDQTRDIVRNWVATRAVTGDRTQDPDILARTRKLDVLQATAMRLQQQRDGIADEQRALEVRKAQWDKQVAEEKEATKKRFFEGYDRYELKMFGLRLALTLPILLAATWLFIRYRRARYWPFVHGFGWFALSAFFVELVPYLPEFGGYVRVLVGITLTVFAGVYMLSAFQRYAERKRVELRRSPSERAGEVGYDKAMRAFEKKLCPSCDKPSSPGGDGTTFCVHCGLKLFNLCGCGGRNFFYFPHCQQCGTAQKIEPADATVAGTL
jgi:hypothetical protein